jgi:hypothetical protein
MFEVRVLYLFHLARINYFKTSTGITFPQWSKAEYNVWLLNNETMRASPDFDR